MANQTRADSNLRHTVPYAPWSQFKHFLDKIKVLNPRIIDAEYLRSNQMGGQQPGSLMTTIQFLGLVDADGTPTDWNNYEFEANSSSPRHWKRSSEMPILSFLMPLMQRKLIEILFTIRYVQFTNVARD